MTKKRGLVFVMVLLIVAGLCLAGCSGSDSEPKACQWVTVTLCSKYDEQGGIVDSYTRDGRKGCRVGYQASHDTRCK